MPNVNPAVSAVIYAVVAGLGAIVTAGKIPATVVEWCGLALVLITTGWGKYTHTDDLLMPPMTDGERRAARGLPPLGK